MKFHISPENFPRFAFATSAITCFFFFAVDTYGQAAGTGDAAGRFSQIAAPSKTPDRVYYPTEASPSKAVSVSEADLHGDDWDVQYSMGLGGIVPNPQKKRSEEQILRNKAKLAYRMWKMQTGGYATGETGIEPEAKVFNPDGSIQESWLAFMESGEIQNFDVNAPDPAFEAQTQSESAILVDNPNVGVSVDVTYNNQLSPPDGACATNASGISVTASNTWIEIFNSNGTVTYSESPETFFNALNPTAMIYDPRVIYDTFSNRFIMIYLHGNSSNLSQLYMAFSKTSNPSGGWWFYKRQANTGDTNMWFDYPQAAYSDGTLTISGNLFFDGIDAAQESRVWMLDLDAAYAGDNMGAVYFDDVEIADDVNSYSIHPCSYPFGEYGPGLWMISRFGNDFLGYWYITANYGDSPTLNTYFVEVPFSINGTGVADQAGTWTNLEVPGRMMNTYVNPEGDDKIHFTFAYQDGNGDHRILLGRLNTQTENIAWRTFGSEGWDYALPWIMPWAPNASSWDGSSLVAFGRVSSTTFPSFRCIVGHPADGWSPGGSTNIKTGETQIQNSRWGDYIGGGFREGQSDAECWIFGQYGEGNAYGTWLAQVALNIEGCTQSAACNYNPAATVNDGSCEYSTCSGCMDAEACNFNTNATIDDGSCTYPGCTNFFSCNYDPAAGCNDGSCCTGTCVDLTLPSGTFDPNVGVSIMSYTLTDNDTGDIIASGNNIGFGDMLTPRFCLAAGCYTLSVTGFSGGSWSLDLDPVFFFPGQDLNIASGIGPATVDFSTGGGGAAGGCTDSEACNFDSDAICDNGSCCYNSCLSIAMSDSYGDGWNGNTWEVVDADSDVAATGTLDEGYDGTEIACLQPGCYSFRINSSSGIYTNEVSWSISGIDADLTLGGDAYDEVGFTIGGGGDDVGCTDPEACNYDAAVTCEDGSCCYDNCGTLILSDSFGDGWNGALLSLSNGLGFSVDFGMTSGATDTLDVCLPDGCLSLGITSGTYASEIGWAFTFSDFAINGGAPFETILSLDAIMGCTDPSACNFNPAANCPDGSCIAPGCTDPMACNYSECATCDNGVLCSYGCNGCMYPNASNYDPNATVEDGSCTFEIAPSTSCQSDIDNDGQVAVSDILIVLGEFGSTCSE